jgi:hypothetical protein
VTVPLIVKIAIQIKKALTWKNYLH